MIALAPLPPNKKLDLSADLSVRYTRTYPFCPGIQYETVCERKIN